MVCLEGYVTSVAVTVYGYTRNCPLVLVEIPKCFGIDTCKNPSSLLFFPNEHTSAISIVDIICN